MVDFLRIEFMVGCLYLIFAKFLSLGFRQVMEHILLMNISCNILLMFFSASCNILLILLNLRWVGMGLVVLLVLFLKVAHMYIHTCIYIHIHIYIYTFAQKGGTRGQRGEGTHGQGREHVKWDMREREREREHLLLSRLCSQMEGVSPRSSP